MNEEEEILSEPSQKSLKSIKSNKSKDLSEKSNGDSKKSSSKTKSKISEKDKERLQTAYAELEVLVKEMEQKLPANLKQLLELTSQVQKVESK